jgi:hypothetical protein
VPSLTGWATTLGSFVSVGADEQAAATATSAADASTLAEEKNV